jgi:DNA polymerase-4
MILHLDMDAFYASVEIRDNPRLVGLPVVVGGSPKGRGVIAAASYAARKFGVHSAMSSAQALRLCPNLIFIKPRMDHYAQISKQIREIFENYTSLVEPLSLDEAFLDVSGSEALFGDAVSIARQIKERIKTEVGVTASAGVASNKFLAKLASDLQKPDGLVVVPPDAIEAFLDPLAIGRVWGVGKQTQKKMESLGVQTIQQLRSLSAETLKAAFGLNGEHFWRLARGLDTRPVVPDREAKSISHETTFYIDIEDPEVLRAWLLELTDQVARRMRRYEIVGKTVQIKLRYSNFETITRARTLAEPTNLTDVLATAALQLFAENSQQLARGIRLLGMGVSHLSTNASRQLTLFDQEELARSSRLDSTRDQIRDRFGSSALTRAANLRHQIEHRPDPKVKD